MSAKIETLRVEMQEIGEKIREINSKDNPEKADFDSLKEYLNKMDERREQLNTLERAEAMEKDLGESSNPEARGVEIKEEPKVSLGEYLQAVASWVSPIGERSSTLMPKAKAREILSPRAATGASETVPSDGGFLVGTQQAGLLAQRAYGEGKIAQLVERVTISGPFNGLKYPVIDESSRANGSRAGGILAYWKNEAAALAGSKPKVREDSMNLEKLTGLFYATDELLQDAAALEGMIVSEFGKEFSFKLDDAILNGTGAGQPLGIYNASCLVSQDKETGQAADTINYNNIINMYSRLWSGASMDSSRWTINREAFPQLMKLSIAVGTGGFPLYIPGNSAANAPFGTLLGVPVIFAEQAQALGDKGDIYLSDFGQYRMIEKGGIQAASSMHVQFVYDEMVFRFIYRVNGQPLWKSALTPYKGSATVSPFVTLAARA